MQALNWNMRERPRHEAEFTEADGEVELYLNATIDYMDQPAQDYEIVRYSPTSPWTLIFTLVGTDEHAERMQIFSLEMALEVARKHSEFIQTHEEKRYLENFLPEGVTHWTRIARSTTVLPGTVALPPNPFPGKV